MIDAKIGDNIYLKNRSGIFRVETVTKITPTLIRSENYSYRKEDLRIRGQDNTWHQIYAHLETPELKQEWHELTLKRWLSANWLYITVEEIETLKKNMEKRNG